MVNGIEIESHSEIKIYNCRYNLLFASSQYAKCVKNKKIYKPNWNFTGVACESSCNQGMTGIHCSERCSCSNRGSCTQGTTAKCTCESGWTGTSCNETCSEGTYGFQCLEKCLVTAGMRETQKYNVNTKIIFSSLTQEPQGNAILWQDTQFVCLDFRDTFACRRAIKANMARSVLSIAIAAMASATWQQVTLLNR